MNILHVSSFDRGGAGIACLRLHEALKGMGINSKVLLLKNDYPLPERTTNIFKNPSPNLLNKILIRSNRWKSDLIKLFKPEGFELFSFSHSFFDITKTLEYQNADLVHLHWVTHFVDLKKFLCFNDKPLVWTLHDMNLMTGGCHYSDGCFKYSEKCQDCPQVAAIFQKLVQKELSVKIKIIQEAKVDLIFLSEWMIERYKHSNINKPMHKIYNSVDTSVFRFLDNKQNLRRKWNIRETEKVVLFISDDVTSRRKGFSLVKSTITSNEPTNILYLSVGHNYEDLSNLKNVKHLGPIYESEDLNEIYNIADVFILPSKEDNLPNVMLESLCAGTPVISFKGRGGMDEIIREGINGILLETYNHMALYEGLKSFFCSASKYDPKAVSELAHDTFSPKRQTRMHLELYNKLVYEEKNYVNI